MQMHKLWMQAASTCSLHSVALTEPDVLITILSFFACSMTALGIPSWSMHSAVYYAAAFNSFASWANHSNRPVACSMEILLVHASPNGLSLSNTETRVAHLHNYCIELVRGDCSLEGVL